MHTWPFALGSAVQMGEALMARLLCSPTFPQLDAVAYEHALAALSE